MPEPNLPDGNSVERTSHTDVYRILDASANRAGEGIRTMEECARFILDDAELTAAMKSLRHDLTLAMKAVNRNSLLSARDTPSDVGTEITVATESSRSGMVDVVAAAATRTAQSLRVLEEYGKIVDSTLAGQIEQIRYRCYTLGGHLEQKLDQNERLSILGKAQIYGLISAGESDDAFAEKVRRLCDSGIDVLQLRDRNQDDRTLFERGRIASHIVRDTNVLFIVNDRADLAAATNADGVHVGQDELPVDAARRIVGPNRLIGVSTHDTSQVDQAIAGGADYIGCGPVFAGTTKCFDEYAGPEFLKAVHDLPKTRPIPAFAIGGITTENVTQVAAAGFHRVAVTGAIRDADDPSSVISELRAKLRQTGK